MIFNEILHCVQNDKNDFDLSLTSSNVIDFVESSISDRERHERRACLRQAGNLTFSVVKILVY